MGDNSYHGDPGQAAVRGWLRQVLAVTGWSLSGLAKKAGLAATTLTRFHNQPVKYVLSTRTLARISAASHVPMPAEISERAPLETDSEVLKLALEEARKALVGVAPEEYRDLEADVAAQVYDGLMDALRDGRSLDDAVKAIGGFVRRQTKRRGRKLGSADDRHAK